MDLLSIRTRVARILETDEASRDCDLRLMALIWWEDIQDRVVRDHHDFLDMLQDGQLTHFESATRVRRALQEKYPSLRGQLWEARHAEEEKIKQQLDLFDDGRSLSNTT